MTSAAIRYVLPRSRVSAAYRGEQDFAPKGGRNQPFPAEGRGLRLTILVIAPHQDGVVDVAG
jgi:hypothetical protein